MTVIIAEPGKEVQVFTDVVTWAFLPNWSVDAKVCSYRDEGYLVWNQR